MPCSRTQHSLTRVGLEPPTSGSGVRGINHQATALPYNTLETFFQIKLVLVEVKILYEGTFSRVVVHIYTEMINKRASLITETGQFRTEGRGRWGGVELVVESI